MKMPHKVLGRLKYITKKEEAIKSLIFGDKHNNDIADDVITGLLVPDAVSDAIKMTNMSMMLMTYRLMMNQLSMPNQLKVLE